MIIYRYLIGSKIFSDSIKVKPYTSKSAKILLNRFRKAYPNIVKFYRKLNG